LSVFLHEAIKPDEHDERHNTDLLFKQRIRFSFGSRQEYHFIEDLSEANELSAHLESLLSLGLHSLFYPV